MPDLYLMKDGVGYWVEVKLRHANYRRDKMSEAQWYWYHNRRMDFGRYLRYGIVESAEELLEWAQRPWEFTSDNRVHIPDYHYKRYEEWRRGR